MSACTDIEEMVSEKLLGKGRWRRKLTRHWCRWRGHRWHPWSFDWPYDVFDIPGYSDLLDEAGMVRDPHPDEVLLWLRGCERDCGVIQAAKTSLHNAGTLPGNRTALYNNPIRRMMKR